MQEFFRDLDERSSFVLLLFVFLGADGVVGLKVEHQLVDVDVILLVGGSLVDLFYSWFSCAHGECGRETTGVKRDARKKKEKGRKWAGVGFIWEKYPGGQ